MRLISAVLTKIFSVLSGTHNGLAFTARASALGLGLLALAACTTDGTNSPPPQRVENRLPEPNSAVRNEVEQPTVTSRSNLIRPAHMGGQEPVRVALLLPLGDASPQAQAIAQSMRNAAELAVFRSGRTDLLLLTKDTRGTVPGAQEAAREAITEGAEIILGPLFANNVEAITPIARGAGLSVIAFQATAKSPTWMSICSALRRNRKSAGSLNSP